MVKYLLLFSCFLISLNCRAQSKNPYYDAELAGKAGTLLMELHPWYGSAGLVEAFKLHKKVEKISVAD